MFSCSHQNPLENLFENWLHIEDLIEQNQDYQPQLDNFICNYSPQKISKKSTLPTV